MTKHDTACLEIALVVAARALEDPSTTDVEREAVLHCLAAHSTDSEQAEAASRALHHLLESRRHQLLLKLRAGRKA